MGEHIVTLSSLRKKYPNPVKPLSGGDTSYCVGGALCKEMGMDYSFPYSGKIRDAVLKLRKVNKYEVGIDDNDFLLNTANRIASENDAGKFEEAWEALGVILRWKPKFRTGL